MEKAIEKIIEKISSYEILNNIIPGAIYVMMADHFTRFSLQQENFFVNVVIYYFAGMVIGRIGSLVIEPILRLKTKKGKAFVYYAEYTNYVDAEKLDEMGQIKVLSTINNMYRTLASAMLCLLITIFINSNWDFITAKCSFLFAPVCFILLAIIFIFSYRKQSDCVKTRVEKILQGDGEDMKTIQKKGK